MFVRSKFSGLVVAGLIAVLTAGCSRDTTVGLGAETDDPSYREGQNYYRQGRTPEALNAYRRVIDKRGEAGAAESHLEVGIILKQHIKDPLTAIYHFNKYLELRPNSPQAFRVLEQKKDAEREYARTLPGDVLESQTTRLDHFEQITQLRREVERLRAENAALRGSGGDFARPTTTQRVSVNETPVANAAAPASIMVDRTLLVPAPVQISPEADSAPSAFSPLGSSNPAIAERTTRTSSPAPARPSTPAGGRRHVVAPKESLWGIAKKYYGTATNANVQGIVQANRDVLRGDSSVKEGMELRIP